MKDHVLQLDYDGVSLAEVIEDIDALQSLCRNLGYALVKRTGKGWHVVFPMSRLSFEKALKLAEKTRCDKEWLRFSRVIGCMTLRTSEKLGKNSEAPRVELAYWLGQVLPENPYHIFLLEVKT